MKKLFGVLLTLSLVAVLFMGCGGKGANATTSQIQTTTSAPATTSTAPITSNSTTTSVAPTTSIIGTPPSTTPATSTTATSTKTTTTSSTPATSGNDLSGLISISAGYPSYYCDIKITSPDGTQNMKEWVKTGNPTKYKMEVTSSGLTTDIIYDGQYYYTYIPSENMGYKMSAASAASYSSDSSGASSISQYTPVYIGAETVNGIDCSKYQYTVSGVTTQMWISKQYGLPVRVVSGTTTMDYTNFSFTGITDSMFIMPSGVTMITMPGI